MKAKVKTWIRNVENGMIKSTTERVLLEIKNVGKSNTDLFTYQTTGIDTETLRNRLGMAHQTLTSRLSELQDNGLIKVIGEKQGDDSVYSVYTYVSDSIERETLAEARKKEKFAQWMDRGLNEFWDLLPLSVKINLKQMKESN